MRIGGFRIALLALLIALLAGCASPGTTSLRGNTGDMIVERLKVGMSNAEIDAAIADLRKWISSDGSGTIRSEFLLHSLYQQSYFPKDVLSSIEVGERCRALGYWTNPAGGQVAELKLFYDADQRLRGWVNYPSAYSQDKFMHEALTSRLTSAENGVRRGMSRSQVRALIGPPVEVVPVPAESRAVYDDHFWNILPNLDPPKQRMEVYKYSLSDGSARRVFLLYYPAADELNSWGYDHAWEEAERYEREKAKSP
jgi:hypothetical protein